MPLFLARFTITNRDYPDSRSEQPNQFRIVDAEDEWEARKKLEKKIERDDPYGFSISIDIDEINEVIS